MTLPSLPTMLDAPYVPFTALDRALVRALLQVSPLPEPPNPRHLWLAALASHQLGRGHACLDLRALEAEPQALLGCFRGRSPAGTWRLRQTMLLPIHPRRSIRRSQ